MSIAASCFVCALSTIIRDNINFDEWFHNNINISKKIFSRINLPPHRFYERTLTKAINCNTITNSGQQRCSRKLNLSSLGLYSFERVGLTLGWWMLTGLLLWRGEPVKRTPRVQIHLIIIIIAGIAVNETHLTATGIHMSMGSHGITRHPTEATSPP